MIIDRLKKYFYLTKKDILFFILIAVISTFLDLLSKYLIFALKHEGYYITSFFNIIKVKNFGISFGLFNEIPAISFYFIIIFDICIVLYLIHLFQTKNDYKTPNLFLTSLNFIIGGAFGNLIDRVCNSSVRDFLDFHINYIHWPCFNVADIFICIGVAILAICEIFLRQKIKS